MAERDVQQLLPYPALEFGSLQIARQVESAASTSEIGIQLLRRALQMRLIKNRSQTARQGDGARHADLLSKDRTHCELERVGCAGYAQSRQQSDAISQQSVLQKLGLDDIHESAVDFPSLVYMRRHGLRLAIFGHASKAGILSPCV